MNYTKSFANRNQNHLKHKNNTKKIIQEFYQDGNE